MDKVYISGNYQTIGNQDDARRAYYSAVQRMSESYEVFTPLIQGLPTSYPQVVRTAYNIMLLLSCNAVYMLPSWIGCRECILEKNMAELSGKKIIYEKELPNTLIVEAICDACNVTIEQLASRDRHRELTFGRMIFARYCKDRGMTLIDIGKCLNRTHPDIIHLLANFDFEAKNTRIFKDMLTAVNNRLSDDKITL
jgi:hypothetical protein